MRELIQQLQPYNSPDPRDSLLFILHDMDATDKHRELVLCYSKARTDVPFSVLREWKSRNLIPSDKGGRVDNLTPELIRELKKHAKIVPQIAFSNFGRRPAEPVVPALMELYNFTNGTLLLFYRQLC